MAISALQARDPGVREDRCGTRKRWELRELSAGGEVSVESQIKQARKEGRPVRNLGGVIHGIEVCCFASSDDVHTHAAFHQDPTGEWEERE